MIIIDDIQQGTPGWMALKAGVPSASEFDKILSPTGKASTQAEKYRNQLIGERLLGTKPESYKSQAMIEGSLKEDEARALFSMLKGVECKQVAFCFENNKRYGCSPDAILDLSGLEIKCPELHTHVQYLMDAKLPTTYISQVQGSMLVSGYSHWFFMSYYPGLPELIIDVPRDDKYCAQLKVSLEMFCDELEKTYIKLEAQLRNA
jgi:predicted phage-related endonuclease